MSKVNTTRSTVTNIAANQAIPALVADAENTRSIGLVNSNETVINDDFITGGWRLQDLGVSFIRPVYVADGPVGGGGCAAAWMVRATAQNCTPYGPCVIV